MTSYTRGLHDSAAWKPYRSLLAPAVAVFSICAGTPATAEFVTFDVPGNNVIATAPFSINGKGVVTGFYTDTSNIAHGFVMAADGTITPFDFSGAKQTEHVAINKNGTITGNWSTLETGATNHGFVLDANGGESFDPTGSIDTVPVSINNKGEIAGDYTDGSHVLHGFLRTPAGEIAMFDPPGSSQTDVGGISQKGTIVGHYEGALVPGGPEHFHGFLRARDGTFTTFDPPGSSNTVAVAIAREEVGGVAEVAVTGYYQDGGFHGFVRLSDGSITTFDVPDATATFPTSVDSKGAVTGYFQTGTAIQGFERAVDGTITTFDLGGNDTRGEDINIRGQITGFAGSHGFIGKP